MVTIFATLMLLEPVVPQHTIELSRQIHSAYFAHENDHRHHHLNFDNNAAIFFTAMPVCSATSNAIKPKDPGLSMSGSSHALTFLALASKRETINVSYQDKTIGMLQENMADKIALIHLALSSKIIFSGESYYA
jgi:hypothetical protein